MKIGEDSLTPYTPEVVDEIRNGTYGDDSGYPYGFRLDADEITFQQWIDGFAFHKVTDPENDEEADAHLDRVYSARVDKSEVGFLEKYPNLQRIEYTEEKSTVLPDEIAERAGVRFLKFEGTKKYKKLPKALPKMTQLEALNIENIASFRDLSLLSELPNLRYLRIYGCSKVEDFSALAALENLEELHLESFWWDAIPDVLSALPNLRHLNLGGSVRDDTDLGVLREMPQLESLMLQWADLQETPPELAELTGLRKLKMEHCEIESFDSIAALKNLEVLDTYGLQNDAVPGAFGELRNLRYLALKAMENLTDVSALRGLELDRLDLSGNGFEATPPELGELTSLRELKLDGSEKLTDVSSIASLKNLDYLDLSFLPMSEYPAAIDELTSLRVLNINSAKFPLDRLAEHPSLEFVYLGYTVLDGEIEGTTYIDEQSSLLFER
jgi:leucine-rich repeat protein SHOC2